MRPDRSLKVPNELLGKRLRDERKALKNRTALEVAKACRMSTSILWRMEQGETKRPMLHTLWKLADYYSVSIDFLVGRSDQREFSPRVKRAA
jgi:transcriptional regulator with XRE-family HTH domain